MANELEHMDATELTLYAKPTPVVVSPWGDDDVPMTEVGATGYYSANVVTPSDAYTVYMQVGGTPASTDIALSLINMVALQGAVRKNLDQITYFKPQSSGLQLGLSLST